MHVSAPSTEVASPRVDANLLAIDIGKERASVEATKPGLEPVPALRAESTRSPFWQSDASLRITLLPGPDDSMGIPPFVAFLFDIANEQDFPEPSITSGLSQGNSVQMSCRGGTYVVRILFPRSYMLQPLRQENPLLLTLDGTSSTHLRLPMPQLVTRKISLATYDTKSPVPDCEFVAAVAPKGLADWALHTDSEGWFECRTLSDENLESSRASAGSDLEWVSMRTLLKSAEPGASVGLGLWDSRSAVWLESEGFVADVLLGPLEGDPGRVTVRLLLQGRVREGGHGYKWLGDNSWRSALRCSTPDSYRIQTHFVSGTCSDLWADVLLIEKDAVLDLGSELQLLVVPTQVDKEQWQADPWWGPLQLTWACKRNSFTPRAFGGTMNWSPGEALHLLADGQGLGTGRLTVTPQTRPGNLLIGEIKVTADTPFDPLEVRLRHYEIRCVDAARKPVPHAGVTYTLFGGRNAAHAFSDENGILRISLFGESPLAISPIGVQASSVISVGNKAPSLPAANIAGPAEFYSSDPPAGPGRRVLLVPGFPTRVQVRVESDTSLLGTYACIYREGPEPSSRGWVMNDPDYPVENGLLDGAGRTEFHGLPEGRYRVDVMETPYGAILSRTPTYVEVSRETPKPKVLIKLEP